MLVFLQVIFEEIPGHVVSPVDLGDFQKLLFVHLDIAGSVTLFKAFE
jgi:hypothetical protein